MSRIIHIGQLCKWEINFYWVELLVFYSLSSKHFSLLHFFVSLLFILKYLTLHTSRNRFLPFLFSQLCPFSLPSRAGWGTLLWTSIISCAFLCHWPTIYFTHLFICLPLPLDYGHLEDRDFCPQILVFSTILRAWDAGMRKCGF